MELGLQANVSARHINFIERGRARPSRSMVVQLAQTLEMSKADTNLAALAAGHAPIFKQDPSSIDLAPLRSCIRRMLDNHMPFPGIVLDKHWNIIDANEAARFFLHHAGFANAINIMEALAAQPPEESSIENWHEAVALILYRSKIELAHAGDDPILFRLITSLEEHFHKFGGKDFHVDFSQAMLPTRFKIGGKSICMFSTIAHFGTVFDMSICDIQIELMFPSDPKSEAALIEIDQKVKAEF